MIPRKQCIPEQKNRRIQELIWTVAIHTNIQSCKADGDMAILAMKRGSRNRVPCLTKVTFEIVS